jgi:DNA-binding IclR family transcriptional regulator
MPEHEELRRESAGKKGFPHGSSAGRDTGPVEENRWMGQMKPVGPRSALRALDILNLLSNSEVPHTLTSISEHLSLPKTSTLSLLRMLEKGSYTTLERSRYELGPQAFQLALAINRNRGFPGMLHASLEQLARACNETCFLGSLCDNKVEVEYLDVIESANPLRYAVRVGDVRPLHSSTVGKISLAHFGDARLGEYFRTVERKRYTEMTITDENELRAQIAQIRRERFAENISAMIDGLSSYGVPIYSLDNRLVGAVVASGPAHRMEPRKDELHAMLTTAGQQMSRLLNSTDVYPPSELTLID